jgi:hypothetical protein
MDAQTKANLLLAYGILREQEDAVYTLMALIVPLVKCLGQYDHRLADMYAHEEEAMEEKIFQKRADGFAAIDEAIRRLKENVSQ